MGKNFPNTIQATGLLKRGILERLPLEENSDDFVFDNQMLSQVIYFGYKIGEISCPAKYFPEASSINFRRSLVYGLGVLLTSIKYFSQKQAYLNSEFFLKKAKN